MEGARETRRGVVKSSTVVKDIGIRRALRDIRNLVAEPSYACAISHKSKIGLHENKTTYVARRPVTRKFAATFASESQTSRQNKRIVKENQDEKSVSLLTSSNCLNICTEVDEDGTTVDEMEEMDQSGLKDVEMEDHTIYSFPDIDSCDSSNPLAVIEYVEDIYTFYRETEVASCASPDYMSQQFDINEKMRAILIDWLIEVHYKFELMDETIFLTVNIIDRFLERQTVARKKLQLVGVTAMLLACKYEEVSVPVVQDLILISDRAYTREEILEMEIMILNTLQFNMSVPTPYVFMRRFLKAADSDKKLELLSFFIIELCLVEYKMVKFQPSLLAAAAIYTAHCTLQGYKCWNRTCEIHTTYSEDQLLECSRFMVDFHQNAGTGKLTGVHRKYSTFKYGYTTKLEPAHFLLNTDL